jgi:hypothetical protein
LRQLSNESNDKAFVLALPISDFSSAFRCRLLLHPKKVQQPHKTTAKTITNKPSSPVALKEDESLAGPGGSDGSDGSASGVKSPNEENSALFWRRRWFSEPLAGGKAIGTRKNR